FVAQGVAGHDDHAGGRDDAGVIHEIAGLHILRLGDPAVEVFVAVLKQAGGDGGAGANAGEVGADHAHAFMATDSVAAGAAVFAEILTALGDEGGVFVGVDFLLRLPGPEGIGVEFLGPALLVAGELAVAGDGSGRGAFG